MKVTHRIREAHSGGLCAFCKRDYRAGKLNLVAAKEPNGIVEAYIICKNCENEHK